MGEQTGAIVWQRRYDEAAHQRSLQRFWKFYAIPAALLIIVVALTAGVGPAAGLLILLGLFGAMVFVWVWLTGRNERTNPTVTQDAGDLCWGKRRVPINQIVHFSTYMTSSSIGTSAGSPRMEASLGAARFLLVDRSEVEFVWAELEEAQLAELRAALEKVLPGRWRPIESLRDPS